MSSDSTGYNERWCQIKQWKGIEEKKGQSMTRNPDDHCRFRSKLELKPWFFRFNTKKTFGFKESYLAINKTEQRRVGQTG